MVVVSARGRSFSSGLDCTAYLVNDLVSLKPDGLDPARNGLKVSEGLRFMQGAIYSVEACGKPVIAVLHGNAMGAGLDLACACDIRYCSADTKVSVRQPQLGFISDMGALVWMPKITGNGSWVRELAYTARLADAQECLRFGLVSKVLDSQAAALAAAMETATVIADKSPIAMHGTKINLNYARDHGVTEGLHFISVWQAANIQAEDVAIAVQAAMTKTKPEFPKL